MVGLALGNGVPSAERLLVLGAHADDIEIGCGGTLLRLAERYPQLEICWVVLSATEERADEARQSATAFLDGTKAPQVILGGFRDGFLPFQGVEVKEFFEGLKQDFSPDLIFTHQLHDRHQDHRLVSELTWNTFRNHLILEYEIPKYDGDLGTPNVFVHLDDATCRRKVDALLTYFPTQSGKQWFTEDTFFASMRLRGMEANSPTRHAEAFYSRKLVLQP